jgi:hypothetical protein
MGDALFNLLSSLPVVLDVLVSGLYNLFYLVTNPAAEEARVFVPIVFNSTIHFVEAMLDVTVIILK